MRAARALMVLASLTLPQRASAELPMTQSLDPQASARLDRLLEHSDFPEVSWSSLRIALIGALAVFPRIRRVAYRHNYFHLPLAEVSSTRAGRCQTVRLTAWFADGRRPPIRLTGRYCQRTRWVWGAMWQQIRPLGRSERRPALPPIGPNVAEFGS